MTGFIEHKAIVNKKYQEKKRRQRNEPSFEEKIKQEIRKLEKDPRIISSKVKHNKAYVIRLN